ncbi:MAG: hypothetical protein LBQ67_03345 [Treponema sp.]|nr:hypothetical protein [Treponema sp.]
MGFQENSKRKYIPWYEAEGNNYSQEAWQECLYAMEQLSLLKINHFERFKSLEDAKYIYEQRQKLDSKTIDKDKALTVAMYPCIDKNNAFSAQWNTLPDIIARPAQQLLYFEITGDADLKSALNLLKTNLPDGQELTLILTGHGNKDLLQWDSGTVDYYLDPTDYTDQKFTGLLHGLDITLVIFDSCKAGYGGNAEENQANRFAGHIRPGGKVIAPVIDIYRVNYLFNADDGIQGVTYNTGDPAILYQVEGRFPP